MSYLLPCGCTSNLRHDILRFPATLQTIYLCFGRPDDLHAFAIIHTSAAHDARLEKGRQRVEGNRHIRSAVYYAVQ